MYKVTLRNDTNKLEILVQKTIDTVYEQEVQEGFEEVHAGISEP